MSRNREVEINKEVVEFSGLPDFSASNAIRFLIMSLQNVLNPTIATPTISLSVTCSV